MTKPSVQELPGLWRKQARTLRDMARSAASKQKAELWDECDTKSRLLISRAQELEAALSRQWYYAPVSPVVDGQYLAALRDELVLAVFCADDWYTYVGDNRISIAPYAWTHCPPLPALPGEKESDDVPG